MRLVSQPVTRVLTAFVLLLLVGVTSCTPPEADVVMVESLDVGASVMSDVESLTSSDAGWSYDVAPLSGVDGGTGLAGVLPEASHSGQMVIRFTGEYHAAAREFTFAFEDSEVSASSIGGLRTSSQALWCSSRLTVVRDGRIGTNPPETFEMETGSISTYAGCDPGTYPDGTPSLISYADLANSEGALCANITVRSFYSVPFQNVYAWIYEVNPIDNYAYTWGDRFLDGLGNGAEPPSGDNAPSDNRGGLFYYGNLTARSPGLPSPGSERAVNWVFRYPIDGANFNFRGLLVASFTETCNGIDDDCDGSIDEGSACEGQPCCFGGQCRGVCNGSVIDSTGACVRPALYGADVCDGFDNDCDGSLDESDVRVGALCPTGLLGLCGNGTGVCDAGAFRCQGGATPAAETCDSADNDCDGDVDEGVASTWYRDADDDGAGRALSGVVVACSAPIGFVANDTDCNDQLAAIRPGAVEIAGDEVDQNCDGAELCFADADDDGFRVTDTVVSPNTTCADAGEARASEPATDCDDTRSSVNPAAVEVCNGLDDNCDGRIDETGLTTYYRDGDGDGYGDAAGGTTDACGVPTGYAATSDDCNDGDASIRPGATEVCNGVDDNCVGGIDEGGVCSGTPCCFGGDCDGVCGTAIIGGDGACAAPPLFGAEVCDSADNDCDGSIDEGVQTEFYRDVDGDGFGRTASGTTTACSAPSGYVSNTTDCNDGNGAVYPGAPEVPGDEVDQSCDGAELCFVDADNDGYRLATTVASANVSCGDSGEARSSEPTGDCNDGNSAIRPGATEVCNGVDDNCDGSIDEGVQSTFYRDADGDGFGSSASGTTAACSAPSGYVSNSSDCNDGNASIRPGGTEVCNGADDDCDGSIDEGVQSTFYRDVDGDGYGNAGGGTTVACFAPGGFSASNNDCNDSNGNINPGRAEVCNGVDDNCDGAVDNGAPANGASDDGCDNIDNDCDGNVDEDFVALPGACCLPCYGCGPRGIGPCGSGVYQEFQTEFRCFNGNLQCRAREDATCNVGAECF